MVKLFKFIQLNRYFEENIMKYFVKKPPTIFRKLEVEKIMFKF